MVQMVRTIQAAAFKQTCLALMDEVMDTGESIVITKRGKPVAKLAPIASERPSALGCLKGMIEIVAENFTLAEWKVSGRKANR